MVEAVINVPQWLEISAIMTGGISGAMFATRVKFDIFGTICIAMGCGFMGGIIRDLMLQNVGFYCFENSWLIVVSIISACIVFYFGRITSYLDPLVDLLDNISTALWAILGTGKALTCGLDIIPSVILGIITAIGGGICRDILIGRPPIVFQAGVLNGSAVLVGCIPFALLHTYGISDEWAAPLCACIIFAVRYASLFFGWRTLPPRDYSDVVTNLLLRPARKVARAVNPTPKTKVARDNKRIRPSAYQLFLIRLVYGKTEWESRKMHRYSDCIRVKNREEIALISGNKQIGSR